MTPGQFIFKKNDRIGATSAEDDHDFLSECFVDTGDLEILKDINDIRQIIVGRTGIGKSALITKLQEDLAEHVITISPENLALTYVSNSTIIKYFEDIGVNLDPFFKLLWRHVLTVEILRKHFGITKKSSLRKSIFDFVARKFPGNSKKDKELREALNYLEQWGKSFWEATEFRVREITHKLESQLEAASKAQLGTSFAGIGSVLTGQCKLSDEDKVELRSRGQDVVSAAQVQDLTKVIMLLDSVLDDKQQQYYLVVDKLDENWVEEKLRYKLIMALIVTARDLTKVNNAKIIIAMRRDLIDRVFRLTRESGFQEEKYQSLYLPVVWDKKQLIELLDKRIDKLVKRRYTVKKVTHLDLLPKKIKSISITDYIFSRARRPRDIISFFNKCIEAAQNLSRLRVDQLKEAEGEYSRVRLRALADEWSSDYPGLLRFVKILYRKQPTFKLSSLNDSEIENLCLEVAIDNPNAQGILEQGAMKLVDCVTTIHDFKRLMFQVFYKIGLIGLKLQPHEQASWVDEISRSVSHAEIDNETSVVIHPTYYRALGIRDSELKNK